MMKFTALKFIPFFYGKFVLNINIWKEKNHIVSNKDNNRLSKLIERLKLTQMLLPSPHDSEYKGTFETYLEKDETVHFLDRHGKIDFSYEYHNGTRGFIKKVHNLCEEYLNLLYELENQLNKPTEIETVNEKIQKDLTIKNMLFDILSQSFSISVSKEEFSNSNSKKEIKLQHYKSKQFPKELFLYQACILIIKISEFDDLFKKRVFYNLKKTENHEEIIYYKEAKRDLEKYKYSFKNRPNSKAYTDFNDKIKITFQKIDNILKN